MPGITEFHWQNHVHANCVFPIHKEKQEVAFRVGDPIAYLIPMDEVRIQLTAEEISQEEYDRMTSSRHLSFHHHSLNRERNILAVAKSWWRWPW